MLFKILTLICALLAAPLLASAANTTVSTPAAGSPNQIIVQEEGTDLSLRPRVNMIGISTTCADNSTSGRTDCTSTAPILLSSSAIPFIKASSGSMGNNGAITAMTVLPRIYSSGAWLWLPAGAIAAGVPASASWYWFVGSSTTAGTVYNSTYTSGDPTIGTTTAFATTGPGAFTGSTAAVVGPSITLPANTMGINGRVEITSGYAYVNSAGTKTMEVLFGGSTLVSATTATTTTSGLMRHIVQNRGLATVQYVDKLKTDSGSAVLGSVAAVDLAINTAADVTISLRITAAVATDSVSVESYSISVNQKN